MPTIQSVLNSVDIDAIQWLDQNIVSDTIDKTSGEREISFCTTMPADKTAMIVWCNRDQFMQEYQLQQICEAVEGEKLAQEKAAAIQRSLDQLAEGLDSAFDTYNGDAAITKDLIYINDSVIFNKPKWCKANDIKVQDISIATDVKSIVVEYQGNVVWSKDL